MGSWQPDPSGRHEYRWRDGEAWTEHVADQGVQKVDPGQVPGAEPPAPPAPPTPAAQEAATPATPRAAVVDDGAWSVTIPGNAGAAVESPVAESPAEETPDTPDDESESSAADDVEVGDDDHVDTPVASMPDQDDEARGGALTAAAPQPPSPEPAAPVVPEPAAPAAPEPPAPAAPQPPSASSGATVTNPSPGSTGIAGGVMGDDYDEEHVDRVGLQNSKLLKIRLGGPVYIKRGSMVAYQGQMSFEAVSEGGGLGSLVKRAVSDNALMSKVEGQGDLFVADDADEVHLLQLSGGSLLVNGPNLLAFEQSVGFETVRFKGAGLASGGGLFGMKLTGHGWVAVTCHGTPVRLDTDGQTFVDAQSAVAWSGEVPMTVNVQKLSFKSMRSGDLVQLQFGQGGFVLVQASEGPTVPTHSHG